MNSSGDTQPVEKLGRGVFGRFPVLRRLQIVRGNRRIPYVAQMAITDAPLINWEAGR